MNTHIPQEKLHSAKKYFKLKNESHQIKNVIYNIGQGYAFPPRPVTSELPPGAFHVASTRDFDFILSQVAQKNNHISDEDLTDLMYALSEETEEIRADRNQEISNQIKEENYGFLDVGYFPLHQYNTGLEEVHDGIIKFLNNKEFYESSGLGYKRSILLYGSHGVGKSRYLDWLSKQLINELDAIVIRINSGDDIERLNDYGMLTLNRVINNRLIVFLIEELSSIVSYRNSHLSLLNVLDNPLLRENVLFLSTTNNPEKIPPNIIDRHQRIDVLVEISAEKNKPEFPEAFYEFIFKEPLPVKYKASEWYKKELTPATMKELFIYAQINNTNLDEAYRLIREREELIKNDFEIREPMGFGMFN